jgi:galactokinase
MKQMMAEIRTNREETKTKQEILAKMEDKADANLREIMAAMKASQERMEALMDVSLQTTEDCLEKSEVNQGKVEIKMGSFIILSYDSALYISFCIMACIVLVSWFIL